MSAIHKAGVIGYGWAATAHIAAINACDKAEVTAVYSSRELNAAELSEEYGSQITTYTDLDKMLAEADIDTVSVTSYPYQHTAQAVAAAEAGKHLILEKPMALSLADVYAIRDAVEKAGVRACVCFEARWANQFQSTHQIIEQGLLGDIHYAEVDYYHGIGPWYGQYRWNTKKDAGGSSLLSAGCHAMDALRHCFGGAEVESVVASSTKSAHPHFDAYEYDTTSVTIVNFANGRIGKTASVIDCLQPYYFHVHLVGSEGTLLDNKLYSEKLGLDKTAWSDLSMKMVDSGDVADHPYQSEFEAFFDAVDDDREMPFTSLAEAVKSHEVIFAADLSAAEKRPVSLSELREKAP